MIESFLIGPNTRSPIDKIHKKSNRSKRIHFLDIESYPNELKGSGISKNERKMRKKRKRGKASQ